jgi:hypothetical protein
MVRSRLAILAALVLGCGNSKQEAPAGGGSAGARPAAITDDMAATFEAYVVAFEKLTTDIEHAGTDCKAVLAVVRADTKDIVALAPRGDKLGEGMTGAKRDPAAGEWFGRTYAARMKASAAKLEPLVTACGQDAELKAALNEAMQQFPMMRKKS